MRKTFRISLLIVLVILGSCQNRNRGITVFEPTLSDSLSYAKLLKIDHFEDYTAVEITDPWDTLKVRAKYLLVDREKEMPKELPSGIVIRVPVERAVIYTTVHSSLVEQLGMIDKIVALCEVQYITSVEAQKRVKEGRIADIGLSTSPNIEKIIELDADVIIASPFENSGYGAAEKLGIPIVEAADYMENHPLGRTEWGRFYALLFGVGERGDSLFNAVAQRYNDLKALAADVTNKPSVLLERKYGSVWYVPGGDSYVATLHSDAGADYIFKDDQGTGSIPLSFETVFEKGIHADLWLLKDNSAKGMTYGDLESEYLPYSQFDAYKNRRIYLCNSNTSSYYEDISLHPDWVLEDLIYIYHPELLPLHKQRYYFKMGE